MKNFIYFILGVLLITLISAGTVSVMKLQPAQPKATLVKGFVNKYKTEETIEEYIKINIAKGYILSESTISNSGYTVVIMNKY